MLNKKYQKALEVVALRLGKKIPWFLIGSANLALQGMNFQPSDLDILVKSEDKKEIEKIFSEFKILKKENLPKMQHEEVMYEIDGVPVEFCLEKKDGFYYKFFNKKKCKNIVIDKYVEVCCLKLENEILAYEYLDRRPKARMIKDFLKNKK